VEVTNEGGATANRTWTDEFFLYTTNIYASTDRFITSVNSTIPEAHENKNVVAVPITVLAPDLVPTSLTMTTV
jgi:hypothetical protein